MFKVCKAGRPCPTEAVAFYALNLRTTHAYKPTEREVPVTFPSNHDAGSRLSHDLFIRASESIGGGSPEMEEYPSLSIYIQSTLSVWVEPIF